VIGIGGQDAARAGAGGADSPRLPGAPNRNAWFPKWPISFAIPWSIGRISDQNRNALLSVYRLATSCTICLPSSTTHIGRAIQASLADDTWFNRNYPGFLQSLFGQITQNPNEMNALFGVST